MSDPIIYPFASVELEGIKYSKLHKGKNRVLRSNITDISGQNLYIMGPKMSLGSDIIKQYGYYYIDLLFRKNNKNNQRFLDFVRNVDYLAISEIHENSKLWYCQETDVSLIQIEQEYIPTVKLSTIYTELQAMKLKVAESVIEFYDQDNIAVPHHLIKEDYKVLPLLHLAATYKDDSHLWTHWDVPQLKVILPEMPIIGCQLHDIDDTDEDDEEAIPDIDIEVKEAKEAKEAKELQGEELCQD